MNIYVDFSRGIGHCLIEQQEIIKSFYLSIWHEKVAR